LTQSRAVNSIPERFAWFEGRNFAAAIVISCPVRSALSLTSNSKPTKRIEFQDFKVFSMVLSRQSNPCPASAFGNWHGSNVFLKTLGLVNLFFEGRLVPVHLAHKSSRVNVFTPH
jgi:hypothetical protein